MGEHSGQRGLRRSQPLPPLPTAWPGECPQALGELAGSATTNHRSEAARRASPLRGWTLRCSSEPSSRLWRLGRLPTPLDEALQRVEEQLADHALLSRARDVEALCEQARRGLDQLDAEGRRGLLQDLGSDIKVRPDRTLEIHGFLSAVELPLPS